MQAIDEPVYRGRLVFDLDPQRHGLDRESCGERAEADAVFFRGEEGCRSGGAGFRSKPFEIGAV